VLLQGLKDEAGIIVLDQGEVGVARRLYLLPADPCRVHPGRRL